MPKVTLYAYRVGVFNKSVFLLIFFNFFASFCSKKISKKVSFLREKIASFFRAGQCSPLQKNEPKFCVVAAKKLLFSEESKSGARHPRTPPESHSATTLTRPTAEWRDWDSGGVRGWRAQKSDTRIYPLTRAKKRTLINCSRRGQAIARRADFMLKFTGSVSENDKTAKFSVQIQLERTIGFLNRKMLSQVAI